MTLPRIAALTHEPRWSFQRVGHWILKGENSRVFPRAVRAWLDRYQLPAADR